MLEIQGSERPMLSVLRDEALWWVLWMLLMPGVIALGRRFPFDGGRWRKATAIHLTLAVVLSIGHIAAFGAAYYWAVGPTSWGPTAGKTIQVFTGRYLATDIVIYAAALGVYFAFEYFERFRRLALEAAQAEGRAARLQLSLVGGANPCASHGAQPAFSVQRVECRRRARAQARERRCGRHARAARRSAADDAGSRDAGRGRVVGGDSRISGVSWTSSSCDSAIACALRGISNPMCGTRSCRRSSCSRSSRTRCGMASAGGRGRRSFVSRARHIGLHLELAVRDSGEGLRAAMAARHARASGSRTRERGSPSCTVPMRRRWRSPMFPGEACARGSCCLSTRQFWSAMSHVGA